MPDSTDRALSGRVRVECRAAVDLDAPALEELDVVLQSFVDAIDLGLLHPASLIDASPLGPPADEARRYRGRELTATGIPPGAFRVLNGMLAHFHAMTAPLASAEAHLGDGRVNLLRLAVDYPIHPAALPFALHVVEPADGVAPPALVRVAFAAPPPVDEREAYLRPFATWNRLVWGGYPVEGGAPGESGVGATETHFVTPAVVEHVIESHAADPRCFDLIVNLALTWSARRRVRAVHIE